MIDLDKLEALALEQKNLSQLNPSHMSLLQEVAGGTLDLIAHARAVQAAAHPVQAGEAVDARRPLSLGMQNQVNFRAACERRDVQPSQELFRLWQDARASLAPIASTSVSAPASQVAAQQAAPALLAEAVSAKDHILARFPNARSKDVSSGVQPWWVIYVDRSGNHLAGDGLTEADAWCNAWAFLGRDNPERGGDVIEPTYYVRHIDNSFSVAVPQPTAKVEVQPVEAAQMLSNLLARIHRDGGHREAEIGTEAAVAEADLIVAKLNAASDQQAAAKAPAAQAVDAQSIDTPEFRNLMYCWDGVMPPEGRESWKALVAHIDAHTADLCANLQTAVQEAWKANAALTEARAQLARQGQELEGWRAFIENCSRCGGGMVNGNRLAIVAKELLATHPLAAHSPTLSQKHNLTNHQTRLP